MNKDEWIKYHTELNIGDIFYFSKYIFYTLKSYDAFHNSILIPDDFSTYFSIAVAP